jgi:hypothetical protein
MEAAVGAKGCRAAPPVKSGDHRGRWCLGLLNLSEAEEEVRGTVGRT